MRGVIGLRIVDWNISYAGDIKNKMCYLETLLTDNSIVILQEVKPHAYEYIVQLFKDRYNMIYSLDYRKPGKYDSDARKLGVLVLVSKGVTIIDSGVVERSLFPDRTVYATLEADGKLVKVLALHSLTGCAYYRAKSVQYESLAEFIDEYCPNVIGIDANEPQIDHYDVHQMKFFDNGPGAEKFFYKTISLGLTDAYIRFNGIAGYEEGKPLITSHHIRKKGTVRYDFLFVSENFNVNNCSYFYDEAISAGSDHAIIISDITF